MKSNLASTMVALAATVQLGCGRRGPIAAVPDSTHYELCEIDAQCASGSYCFAGVCDFNCHADADCGASKSCDDRGHCIAGGSAATGFSGHLNLPVQRITLPLGQRSATFRVENDGTDTLERFHVLSHDPAISALPSGGSLPPGTGVDVKLTFGPNFVGPLSNLHVLSTGGKGTLALECHSALAGRLEGTVTPNTPTPLAPAALAMELGLGLSGTLDGNQTLLWPVNAKVQATDDGTNFTATFFVVGLPGTDTNPLFDLPIRRTVTLTGTRGDRGEIAGTYTETIEGLPLADAGLAAVNGTFELRRVSAATGLLPAAAPSFQPGGAGGLPSDVSCQGQTRCPDDPAHRGDFFFANAFAFEQWGEESKLTDGLCQLGAQATPVPCISGDFAARALASFAGASDAKGQWDVWRAIASYGLLSANDDLAKVLEPALAQYNGPAVDEVALNQAMDKLARGLHGGEGPGGLLASANYFAAQRGGGGDSLRDLAPDDAHRFPMVVATRLLVASELLDRMARAGEGSLATLRVAQRAAGSALIDIAALSQLPSAGLATSAGNDITGMSARFGALSSAFDRTRRGLNPAGFAEGFIPFDYDPANPTHDLFQQASASAQGYLAAAQQVEQQLTQSHRDFEASSTALDQALLNAASEAETQVHDLCGIGTDPQTLVGCGPGGKIGAAEAEMQAADTAVKESLDRLTRANLKLGLLQQQAQNEFQDQFDELVALRSDGQTIALYAQHKAQEEIAAKAANLFGDIFNGIVNCFVDAVTFNYGGIIQQVANVAGAGVQLGMSLSDDQLAFQSSQAQSDMQIQMAIGQNIIRDDTLVAQLFDANTEAETAALEINRQSILFTAAVERWKNLIGEVAQAQATWLAKDRDLGRHKDPTFRLYRDQGGMQWDAAMQLLRKWAFLATRAFEYTANASYANGATVFAAANARQLQGYLTDLQDAYQSDQLQNGWGQARVDVISVRGDLLGIQKGVEDPVTGRSVTPAEQFRQVLALPQNRDASGNLSLKFRTSLRPGNGIFSADVCEDRIQSLKMNLVSSSLQGATAYVTLRQVGHGELASCAGGSTVDYQLGGKSAEIPAGLNLPRSAMSDPSLPASTDLFERPVSADSWILTLDTHGDPRNAWIDPRQLDDIELWLTHTARTIQPNG
jgi:hypothetical protein